MEDEDVALVSIQLYTAWEGVCVCVCVQNHHWSDNYMYTLYVF